MAETGAGPGSYNIHKSVWHVNCCSPGLNGGAGWGVFNSCKLSLPSPKAPPLSWPANK